MYEDELNLLMEQWASGFLLNPFWFLDERMAWFKTQDAIDEEFLTLARDTTCEIFAERFLICTAYRGARCKTINEGEKSLFTAILLYLYVEAPDNEQNMVMLSELVRSDVCENSFDESDLQLLFNYLSHKFGGQHSALEHFNEYKKNPAGRPTILKSLARRLCPLFSFRVDSKKDTSIFDFCGSAEIFEMAVALLHNCWESEEASSLQGKATEIAFVTAALHFMHDTYPPDRQTVSEFISLVKHPIFMETEVRNNPRLTNVAKYWDKCHYQVLSGDYDKRRVLSIEEFFTSFFKM